MDEERIETTGTEEQAEPEVYTERPKWQVTLARIGLVIFILFVIYQIFNLATGGKYAYPWN